VPPVQTGWSKSPFPGALIPVIIVYSANEVWIRSLIRKKIRNSAENMKRGCPNT